MQSQVNALTHVDELKSLLQQEARWLNEAQRIVSEARRLRDDEVRGLRLATIRRWALGLIFSLASAAAAGAGYGWVTQPYQAELRALRLRTDFAELVERRALTMTPVERKQFDALMKWNPSAKR